MSSTLLAPHRLSLKLFADPEPGPAVDLQPLIGLFHRFIQEKTLEGLLLDVADYAHVPNGPGILLVGHEVDYSVDRLGGRTGLTTVRKRCAGLPLAETLRDALRKQLLALRAVHASDATPLRFATGELEVQLLDRLQAPNDAPGALAARAVLLPIAAALYGAGVEVAGEAGGDPRAPLTLRVTASAAPDPDELFERLTAPGA